MRGRSHNRRKNMDPRDLPRGDLVNFTTNTATQVADGKVSGLLAVQNTAISDAMTDANAVFSANLLAWVESQATTKELFDVMEASQTVILDQHSDLRFTMKGVNA